MEQVIAPEAGSESGQDLVYKYGVYGITLRSEIQLPLPDYPESALSEVELRTAPAAEFSRRIAGTPLQGTPVAFREYARLSDGSSYIRWKRLGEFVVSADGGTVTCRRAKACTLESFHTYLLGQALSFALVKRGLEPKHSTAVVIDGRAVAFVADCGLGKSSLAGAFLQAGYPVLTDDLLVIQPAGAGLVAYPGPPRLKLFPKMARRFLGEHIEGARMNAFTKKMVIPLGEGQTCAMPIPLQAIYVLAPPDGKEIRFEPLSPREAFLALVENTFNYMHTDTDRLARQFHLTTRLVDCLPVRRMVYPRMVSRVGAVRHAILADLAGKS